MIDHQQWTRKCAISVSNQFDRAWHAGLSSSGNRCFISSVDEDYFVVETSSGQIIWSSEMYEAADLWPLEDAIINSHLEISNGFGAGRYRIFGLHNNYAITKSKPLGIEIHLDIASATLQVADIKTHAILQNLEFEALSGDWAYASFSDDYTTIAVLEPYYVTVFRQSAEN